MKMGLCASDEKFVEASALQTKLQGLQKIIESEEKRNFKLIYKLEAMCDMNGDLIHKNKELVAERKALVSEINASQKRLERLHKAFLSVEIKEN